MRREHTSMTVARIWRSSITVGVKFHMPAFSDMNRWYGSRLALLIPGWWTACLLNSSFCLIGLVNKNCFWREVKGKVPGNHRHPSPKLQLPFNRKKRKKVYRDRYRRFG